MTEYAVEWLAGADDLDGVLAVDRESFSHPWTRAMYEEELRSPARSKLAVLRMPGIPVAGYVSFWLVVDELHINNVAVLQACRQRGLGRALVEFALREAAARGAVTAILEVRQSNEAARALYEDLGFRQVGARAGYYADPDENALVFSRSLQNLE
ncbi:MAG: ribosomal protein S18-alanine N-acetyltransferase [Acidobacteria bacterium]|nr:ribosomal protein S18-alanine N-acetyltransferase [Acidobacteriota bacterium]